MKKLLTYVLGTLFVLPLNAQAACPNLTGEYWCVSNDSRGEPSLDVYIIEQSIEPEFPSVTNFSTRYRSIPGGGDYFSADDIGIDDGFGWITKCSAGKVISVRDDFSALSELYLDQSDKLVRTYNYDVLQTCSRKKI